MRVRTRNGQLFELGLSGRDMQESFTDEKYVALAVGSPQGAVLHTLVDEHWLEWLEIVETAPWLRNWSRSALYVRPNECSPEQNNVMLPSGERIELSTKFKQQKIARAIYTEAVWGYGVSRWLQNKHAIAGTDARTKSNTSLRTIYNLQNLTCPNPTRNYTWDDKIYRGCGLLIPCEFGELDRWLEPLWAEACAMVDEARSR